MPLQNRGLALLFLLLGLFGGTAISAAGQVPVSFGQTAVGATASPQSVLLTSLSPLTISKILVLSQGSEMKDFTDLHTGSCAVGNLATLCTVNVSFQPKYPGTRTGAVVLIGSDSSVIATTYLQGSGVGSLGLLVPGSINTIAGDGAWVYQGDSVAAVAAAIFLPMGEVVDAAGNLYIADSSNNRIRRVDATTGIITTIAGTGTPSFGGDGGLATQASLSNPAGLAMDGAGNLYVADSGNHAIRKIELATGIITTIAGTGGKQGFSKLPTAATSALLAFPDGIAFDAARNLYIADTGNNVIRRVDAATQIETIIAGTGVAGFNADNIPATTAWLNGPWNLTVSSNGLIYIADLSNNRVRRIDLAGIITTVAGNGAHSFGGDGGPATAAMLSNPAAVLLDPAGNLYIGDAGNNRVRRVNGSTGVITTLSGNNSESFGGDGGNADQASLYGPYALFMDGPGNLYVSDMFHNRIREISSNGATLLYSTIRVTRTSPPQSVGFEDDGNAPLNLKDFALNNSALDSTTTTCVVGQMPIGTSCVLGVEFNPQVVGNSITGTVAVQSDSASGDAIVNLSGTVLTVEPTTTTLKTSANPGTFGQPVSFTAQVASNAPSVTGTVTFLDGTTTLGSVTLNSSYAATFTTSSLSLGVHSITASYSGDPSNASSVSTPAISETINQPSTVTLTGTPNPATVTHTVTLTATVTAAHGQPTGNVTFLDGTSILGVIAINAANGNAVLTTTALTPGSHTITASYEGDTNDAKGSATLTEAIAQSKTTSVLAESATTIPVGGSVTFSATVTSADGLKLTGDVIFLDGTTQIGAGVLDDSGHASFSTTSLTPGTHSITASYVGDTNDQNSVSAAMSENVQQLPTVTTVASDNDPANAGSTIHLTALVAIGPSATSDGAITGTVSFKDGTSIIGTANVGADGKAVLAISTLLVGPHSIVASYQGNVNYATSSSTALSQPVNTTSTTTTLASNAASAIAGKPITLTSTVTSSTGVPTGTVLFMDGANVIGQGTVSASGVATLQTSNLAVATHSITAVYKGDSNYVTSTSTPLSQIILIATTTATLSSSVNPVEAGLPTTFTALVSGNGGALTGTFSIHDGQAVLASTSTLTAPLVFTSSSLAVGSHSLTAVYSGDANNSPSTSEIVVENVTLAATQVSLRSSGSPSVLGQSVTFTANVSTRSSVATGKMTFTDGSTVLGSVALDATGSATLSLSTLTAGTHTITASYGGDTTHATSASTAIQQQVVQQVTASITSSVNPSVATTPVSLTVHVTGIPGTTPSGQVVLKDGATSLTTLTLDGTGSAVYTTSSLAVGTHSLVATYAGDANYQTTTSAAFTQTVRAAQTQVALTSSVNPATFGSSVVLSAKVTGEEGTPTGTITFNDGGVTLGSSPITAGVATFNISTLSAGMHSLTAVYNGDTTDGTATSPILAQQVQRTTAVAIASSDNPALRLDPVTITASVTNGGAQPATGLITFKDGAAVLATTTLDANGVATYTSATLSSGTHAITATYGGDTADFASNATLQQVVQLRGTTNALTATTTTGANGPQVTLISVLRWTGPTATPTAPTGTVTFTSGSTVLGTSQVDATGVATLTFVLDTQTQSVVAQYSGDTVYSASSSSVTSVANSTPTQFTLTSSQSTVQLKSKQNITIDVTVASTQNFTDTLSFGCLGLPFAATCTFSTDNMLLKANGTSVVHVVIDTGSPLTAGEQARLESPASKSISKGLAFCFLPGAPIFFFLLRMKRPKKRMLLLSLATVTLSFFITGCGGLNINGTPAGTYQFKLTASGMNTGITQSANITLKVTQ